MIQRAPFLRGPLSFNPEKHVSLFFFIGAKIALCLVQSKQTLSPAQLSAQFLTISPPFLDRVIQFELLLILI